MSTRNYAMAFASIIPKWFLGLFTQEKSLNFLFLNPIPFSDASSGSTIVSNDIKLHYPD